MAFSHLYHTERLRNINPKLSRTIRIAGGVTNSPVWLQIFADIFRATLEIVDVKEHGTLGYRDDRRRYGGLVCGGICCLKRHGPCLTHRLPNPENHRVYQTKYQLYKNLLSEMQSPWKSCSNYIAH